MSEIQTHGKYCGLGCKRLRIYPRCMDVPWCRWSDVGTRNIPLDIDKTANQIIRADACLMGE